MISSVQATRTAPSGNAFWAVIANAGYALSQWGVLIAAARLGGPATLGEYAFALAIAAPVFMATNLRLRFLQAADVSRRFTFRAFFRVRLITVTFAWFACAAIAMVVAGGTSLVTTILGVTTYKAAEAVQDIMHGQFQALERMDIVARYLGIAGWISLATFAVTLASNGALGFACWSMALIRVVIILIGDLPAALRMAPAAAQPDTEPTTGPGIGAAVLSTSRRRRRSDVSAILRMAWPLGIVALLDSLNANVPRYFLATSQTLADVGLFAALSHLAFAGFIVTNSVSQARMPALARFAHGAHPDDFARAARSLIWTATAIGIAGIAGALLLGKPVLHLLYGPEFASASNVLVVIMVGGALSYVALAIVFVLTARRSLIVQSVLYSVSTAAVVAACWWLVPSHGIAGAAGAVVLANACQILASVWLYRWRSRSGSNP